MLTGISWGQFLTFWLVLLVVYYFGVALLFYRTDINHLLKNGFERKTISATNSNEANKQIQEEKRTDQSAVHDLLEELKTVLANAAKKAFQKEELLVALQLLFKKYPSIKNTPFQYAVNNQIIRECLDACSIELESSDLINCW